MQPAGSYLRLTDSCITQLKAQGPSRTCNESQEEEEEERGGTATIVKVTLSDTRVEVTLGDAAEISDVADTHIWVM